MHAPESAALIEKEQSRSRWDEGSRCEAGDELSLSALSLLAVGLVDVLPGPPTRAAGHGLSASARAELRLRFRRALSVEVGGEQRLAVWRPPDAGGAELGARVLDGVVGELRARCLADRLAGAGSLDGALRHPGAGCGLRDGQLAKHADGELPARVLVGLAVLGVGCVGVGDARLPFIDPVSLLAAVAQRRDRRDVPAAEVPDRLLGAALAVGAEALGLGVDAVLAEHVAVGVDDDDG